MLRSIVDHIPVIRDLLAWADNADWNGRMSATEARYKAQLKDEGSAVEEAMQTGQVGDASRLRKRIAEQNMDHGKVHYESIKEKATRFIRGH